VTASARGSRPGYGLTRTPQSTSRHRPHEGARAKSEGGDKEKGLEQSITACAATEGAGGRDLLRRHNQRQRSRRNIADATHSTLV